VADRTDDDVLRFRQVNGTRGSGSVGPPLQVAPPGSTGLPDQRCRPSDLAIRIATYTVPVSDVNAGATPETLSPLSELGDPVLSPGLHRVTNHQFAYMLSDDILSVWNRGHF